MTQPDGMTHISLYNWVTFIDVWNADTTRIIHLNISILKIFSLWNAVYFAWNVWIELECQVFFQARLDIDKDYGIFLVCIMYMYMCVISIQFHGQLRWAMDVLTWRSWTIIPMFMLYWYPWMVQIPKVIIVLYVLKWKYYTLYFRPSPFQHRSICFSSLSSW